MSLVHDKPPSNLARKSSPLSQARWFASVHTVAARARARWIITHCVKKTLDFTVHVSVI